MAMLFLAIINIACKLCMLMVRERIDKWTEDSGMLGEIQGGFRRERRTEDNLFTERRDMGLYEVPLSVSLLGFGIGTMLANYHV